MSSKIDCYLRTHRRAWGLTQNEVACLVGGGNRNRVSRVERDKLPPNGEEILAYSLIFGFSPSELFPRVCGEADDAVMRGAYHLLQGLEGKTSAIALRKRELIEQIKARAIGRTNRTGV